MKQSAAGFRERLAGAGTTHCFCLHMYTDTETFGFTDHNCDLAFMGVKFRASAGLKLSAFEAQSGLASFSFDLTASAVELARSQSINAASQSQEVQSQALHSEIRMHLGNGRFDQARFKLWLVDWQNTQDHLMLAHGHLGDVRVSDHLFQLSVKSPNAGLDEDYGQYYQKYCRAKLGDAACKVDLTSSTYRYQSQVQSVFEAGVIIKSVAAPTGWFRHGTIDLDGQSVAIRDDRLSGSGRVIEFWSPVSSIKLGQSVWLTIGCDFRIETCQKRFSNGINFRGFPHMTDGAVLMQIKK